MKDSWIVLSFVGLLSISTMTLIITHLIRKGIPTIFVLLMLLCVVATVDVGYVLLTHTRPGPFS